MEVYIKIEFENLKIIRSILKSRINSILLLALQEFDLTKKVFPQETVIESKAIFVDNDLDIYAKWNQIQNTFFIEIKNLNLLIKFTHGVSSNVIIKSTKIKFNIRKEEYTISSDNLEYTFSILEKLIPETKQTVDNFKVLMNNSSSSPSLNPLTDFIKKLTNCYNYS